MMGRPWSNEEDARLREVWGHEEARTIHRVLRGRSRRAIHLRAGQLGLRDRQSDPAPGFERFAAAARRAGVECATLRRILAWAGVTTHEVYTLTGGRRRLRHLCVRRVETDAAVRAWCASETVRAAARRLGLPDGTLRDWLAEYPSPAARGASKRLPSTLIDEVVARRRAEYRPRARKAA